MNLAIPRLSLLVSMPFLFLACLGAEDASPRAVARIHGFSPDEGPSEETFLYRADGSVCREDWSDADFRQVTFSDHGKISHTYYFGEPEQSTYGHWNWITADSVTAILKYKGVVLEGAAQSARRYFRNAAGGLDSVRVYERPGKHGETLLFDEAADGSWEVEHRREPFDRATLSLHSRYFRNARGEIDSAYFYSTWYGGIYASNQDSTYNDTTLLVYKYKPLDRLLGGSRCQAPD